MEFADGPIPLESAPTQLSTHLPIPLAVFVVSEMLIATYLERTDISSEWAIHAFVPRLDVVYVTFIVVRGFVLNEEGRAKVKDIGALEGALKNR
jgi:hypothetical protein